MMYVAIVVHGQDLIRKLCPCLIIHYAKTGAILFDTWPVLHPLERVVEKHSSFRFGC